MQSETRSASSLFAETANSKVLAANRAGIHTDFFNLAHPVRFSLVNSVTEKCGRVHWPLPYRWQVLDKDGKTWKDLVNMEEVEKAFCDPSCDTSCKDTPATTSVLSWFFPSRRYKWLSNFLFNWTTQNMCSGSVKLKEKYFSSAASNSEPYVDFISMTYGGSPVRRLSTASSVSKPPYYILTTEWLWYWKENDGKWVEYGQVSW